MEKRRTEYDSKIIGANLKRLRISHDYCVKDIKDFLCLGSVQAYYKYEAGLSLPQTDSMLNLMQLYGVGVQDIVDIPEELD